MHEDGCDNCGEIRELYHYDATATGNPLDGASVCDACNTLAMKWDEIASAPEDGTFHAELRTIIEQAEGTDLALLVPQAQALLALPEDSVAALVEAARQMVGATQFAHLHGQHGS